MQMKKPIKISRSLIKSNIVDLSMFNNSVKENDQNYCHAKEQRSDIKEIRKFMFGHRLCLNEIKTNKSSIISIEIR